MRNPGVFVRYVCCTEEFRRMKAWQWVWSCWMGFSMQKLQIDKEATGIYITRSSLKTEFAICSHSSTQYRNEIVADGIEVRYRLPEKHEGSTLNDNTNTNSVSFDLIQFHLGTFSPSRFHVEPRLLSLSHFLSFSFFFPYTFTSFFFFHLHYHTSQLCTISFPPHPPTL